MVRERREVRETASPNGARWADAVSRHDIEALKARVVRAVRRACPAWLHDRADDIVQNVLVRLLKNPRPGETNRAFSSIYLEKAAYGATIDEIRRLSRRKENPEPELERQAHAVEADPERSALSGELGKGIRECLVRLARSRRMAVTLYLLGCTVPEIARRRAWSFKRAHNLVYRGLGDLRSCLTSKGFRP